MVGDLIKLYEDTDHISSFSDGWIATLNDAVSCTVTEERNGIFELRMSYPFKGHAYNKIKVGRIIVCAASMYGNDQPFRIYDIKKSIKGTAEIIAYHISYDLINFIFGSKSIIKYNSPADVCPSYIWNYFINDDNMHFPNNLTGGKQIRFKFRSDLTADDALDFEGSYNNGYPKGYHNVRSIIGGSEEYSFTSIWNGEFIFDRYNIDYVKQRGEDRGYKITYGKNMTEFKHEESGKDIYDGVLPIWESEENTVTLPENVLWRDLSNKGYRVYLLDLSTYWSETPTVDQIRAAAEAWLSNTDYSRSKTNIKVSFVNLKDTTEYKNIAILETVKLCDTVTVYHPTLEQMAVTKVIKTEYDVIRRKYISIELGDTSATLSTTISGISSSNGITAEKVEVIANKVMNDWSFVISNVTKISDTSFSVTGKRKTANDNVEEITNVYTITKDKDGNTIYTNTTTSEVIKFTGWPDD